MTTDHASAAAAGDECLAHELDRELFDLADDVAGDEAMTGCLPDVLDSFQAQKGVGARFVLLPPGRVLRPCWASRP